MLWFKFQMVSFGFVFATFFVWWVILSMVRPKTMKSSFDVFGYILASFVIALPISLAIYFALDLAELCLLG